MSQGSAVGEGQLEDALARFKLTSFRSGQRDVMKALLAGRDVLCVMPTGGGKSLCYQLPSLLVPGITLVVSPLIALMKDQEDHLQRLGLRVAAIHSGIDLTEQRQRMAEVAAGNIDLCYIAPERLRSQAFLDTVTRVGVAILAIDEAHCISEWGHDFRPDYARLGWFRQKLGHPPTIALTATATDVVRRDIQEQLRLTEPAIFVRGFDRPNLHYRVRHVRGKQEKFSLLTDMIQEVAGPKIIYGASRKACEEVAEYLRPTLGRKVTLYHAGLMPADRKLAQDTFMNDRAEVIVATNAFGMGVDKPDIRAVIHFNLPGTIEAYYQEAGRAGRDGNDAVCELLFSPADRYIQEFFIEGEYPSRQVVLKLLDFLRAQDEEIVELTRQDIKARIGGQASEMAIGASLKILESAGVIERLRSRENMAILRIHESGPDLTDLLPAAAKTQARVLRYLDTMVGKRRGEDVYFHPADVAHELDIDRSTLTNTLRELTERMSLEYIPPFRGSATRVLDRTTPPERLDIDFASIEKRKARELAKLDRMIDYAQSDRCRRQSILSYFGESIDPCGHCDACGSLPPTTTTATKAAPLATADRENLEPVIHLILEAVSQVNGRSGKTAVAAALAGSASKAVQQKGFTKRRWYAALTGQKQKDILNLIHSLHAVGLIDQSGDNLRPTVILSSKGEEVLAGTLPIPTNLPLDDGIRRLAQARTIPEPTRVMRDPSPPPPHDPQDARWTLRVLDAGFTLAECAIIRRMPLPRVLEHLLAICDNATALAPSLFDALPQDCQLLRERILQKIQLSTTLADRESPRSLPIAVEE